MGKAGAFPTGGVGDFFDAHRSGGRFGDYDEDGVVGFGEAMVSELGVDPQLQIAFEC